MSWIPFAIVIKNALNAYREYEHEQSAQFRCRICLTNFHTTDEHRHPPLSQNRQANLVKWQAAMPFLVAMFVGLFGRLVGGLAIPILIIEWLLLWPVWAWAVAYRFRKAQIKENERFYRRMEETHFAASVAAGRGFPN
jgi:hypothetical protein